MINIHQHRFSINHSSFMEEQQQNKELKFDWKKIISHKWIVKNIPFFLFLTMLAVIYIYNGHYADKTIRNINKTTNDLKEMQYEYKTLKSEVMFRSKQSELAKAVEPFGLKELMTPPVVLQDSLSEKEVVRNK
ncbi:MAG TPA: FtsL-like putative cell division protein [Puia sp.]|nr:FtsL-like putative cell division protein [Puia sp.]